MNYKTEPLPHQRIEFERTKDLRAFGHLWEMGLGKTKIGIDTAAHLFQRGKIDGLLVLAPNGVHTNWVLDEFPKHCPVPYKAIYWESRRSKSKKYLTQVKDLNDYVGGLAVLALNHDAILTKAGDAVARRFMGKRKTFLIVDESPAFKTPGAKRTMRLLSYVRYTEGRRIMSGTPITNSPFDIYTQMKLLDLDFWKKEGLDNYTTFKNYFGIFVTQHFGEREIEKCVDYKNMAHLTRMIEKKTSRLLKEDVLDLPPKVYSRRYFDMDAEQIRIYDELRKEFMSIVDGELITAELAIVRLQRLQQVTSGYLPTETGESPLRPISEKNPRIKCLMDTIADVPHKCIIWAKYQYDIRTIMDALQAAKFKAVCYYGPTKPKDRLKALDEFRLGDAQFFVATEGAAGTGLTLVEAKTVIYYNTTFKLDHRLQSEDRAHRYGQDKSVNYIDILALGTVDSKIIKALLDKREIASIVIGDEIKTWL